MVDLLTTVLHLKKLIVLYAEKYCIVSISEKRKNLFGKYIKYFLFYFSKNLFICNIYVFSMSDRCLLHGMHLEHK